MNRYSTPSSRASADTLCQKCLRRGHYSYECTAPTHARPYISRPSRTQQLLNPKLAPKLTTDVLNERLQKEGIADAQLKKVESERSRKRKLSLDSRNSQSRSNSTGSSDSVSTVSTNMSRSSSEAHTNGRTRGERFTADGNGIGRNNSDAKWTTTSRSCPESSTFFERPKTEIVQHRREERRTRRRRNSSSPHSRGRRRNTSQLRSHKNLSSNHSQSRSRSLGKSGNAERPSEPYDASVFGENSQMRSHLRREERRSEKRSRDHHRTFGRTDVSPFSRRLALTQAMNMQSPG